MDVTPHWIICNTATDSVEDFLNSVRPSDPRHSRVPWICVRNTHSTHVGEDESKLDSVLEEVDKYAPRRMPKKDKDRFIAKLVKASSNRCGKFMVRPTTDKVDIAWMEIVCALHDGKLGHCAKVSPLQMSRPHVICVYCEDYWNVEDLRRVHCNLTKIMENCGSLKVTRFKPDMFTLNDIGNKETKGRYPNRAKLPVTLSVEELEKIRCSDDM